ncbi:hypothetical protein GF339_06655 [candidate division KSB3 bacterium]|uniref:Uncharacterized protein n=1 Tax=candidate division KSB3 bacterium TaxID=2044937 RepID=A0A9D5JUP6_9BACT|nr:hypothetical protein [candidate division KSB3 bacterium]MBD3324247.1 hypothetical protein [candidate division KSB3 bacterium]
MEPVKFTCILHEDATPNTLALYYTFKDEAENAQPEEFRQEILQRLEASFDLQEEVTTLQAQVEAYQEYIYELNDRLQILEQMQIGIDQILRELETIKQSQAHQEGNAPKQHAKPTLAIRTLKRLQEKEEEEEAAAEDAEEYEQE